MSRPLRRNRTRLVAAAWVVGLATSTGVPAAFGTAGAAGLGPRISLATCLSTKGQLGWLPVSAQIPGEGAPIVLQVSLMCEGGSGNTPSTPLTDVPVTLSASPAGIVSVRTPRVTTGATGTFAAVLVGVRPGTAHVLVEVADGGVCAREFSVAACQVTVPVVISANGGAGVPTSPKAPPDAVGILPPRHPAQNAPFLVQIPPLGPCNAKGSEDRYDASLACAQFYVASINAARLEQGEHIARMRLPSNWAKLTPDEQLFVTADLERIDRHLPPYVGLSRTLDAVAQAGAVRDEDPDPSSLGYVLGGGANWFPDVVSAAEADYGWMYSDGVGGNVDCHVATDPGCWGHRYDILGRYTGLGCTDCVMGAGFAYPQGQSLPDLTELFVEPSRPGQFPTYFTWAKDVAPYLKG
ncbi:MAG TPA: hypothetical protein VMD28_04055 [Acidimicrobiales bacterium]|nr:hypothetical protein [Acidimicrobiales bacterium]